MNILIVTSEASPLAKTGGLADVCGALPKALKKLGHNVAVIMPAYRSTKHFPQVPTHQEINVWIDGRRVRGTIMKADVPEIGVPVYLVVHDMYYDRDGLYNSNNADYGDNCERFCFFSRAVMEAIRLLNLNVDILHVNDWQTALIPALLEIEYRSHARYRKTASVLTIHNMAFQGAFPASDMALTGLHWKYFNWMQMECFDRLNLMKTGIVFSDAITTVSPSYAQEIQNGSGFGLDSVLRSRGNFLWGITNGIDMDAWDPENDRNIPINYNLETFSSGKGECKARLQTEMHLPVRPDVPLIGMVGRLSWQKGMDLAMEVIHRKAHWEDIQWILLGSGDPELEYQMNSLASKYPQRVAVYVGYSDPLAHRIIAGCDMFLMPSRFEPCGLTQLYSQRYGTIPVVCATGGLKDTVVDCSDANLAEGTATGVRFEHPTIQGVEWGVNLAVGKYRFDTLSWKRMIQRGMSTDFSWERSAKEYIKVYERIQRRDTVEAPQIPPSEEEEEERTHRRRSNN